ncbi:hypothetical protein ALC56_03668, partial [Trachymyrmex septentrionalis]
RRERTECIWLYITTGRLGNITPPPPLLAVIERHCHINSYYTITVIRRYQLPVLTPEWSFERCRKSGLFSPGGYFRPFSTKLPEPFFPTGPSGLVVLVVFRTRRDKCWITDRKKKTEQGGREGERERERGKTEAPVGVRPSDGGAQGTLSRGICAKRQYQYGR